MKSGYRGSRVVAGSWGGTDGFGAAVVTVDVRVGAVVTTFGTGVALGAVPT